MEEVRGQRMTHGRVDGLTWKRAQQRYARRAPSKCGLWARRNNGNAHTLRRKIWKPLLRNELQARYATIPLRGSDFDVQFIEAFHAIPAGGEVLVDYSWIVADEKDPAFCKCYGHT